MTTRQAISELLERVRAADGPDREIDRDMSELFGRRNEHGVLIIADRWLGIAPLTSSLDAIVALIEQELPGFSARLFIHPGKAELARDQARGVSFASDRAAILEAELLAKMIRTLAEAPYHRDPYATVLQRYFGISPTPKEPK